ncbi:hypothetical protein HSBAA_15330 [Vreelandella sulfidaeris]|uniref:Uncharacterized protein n=1 Tax=Vreelandella sulfidaeris TaxID=115553 RepID=A0A455U3P7_9GAMM|nr:hypothetical protein HSBAA_15330 [Halomonas sulfidaeris]
MCGVYSYGLPYRGVTGQFYSQFAVTIAISTVISTINSLTLSPALAAMLLKPHNAPKDRLTRVIDKLFGWIFRPFNRFFNASSSKYQGGVARSLKHRGAVFVVYALLLLGTGVMFKAVPPGFIPVQDKLYLIAGVILPEGASGANRPDAPGCGGHCHGDRRGGACHCLSWFECAAVHQHLQYWVVLSHPQRFW